MYVVSAFRRTSRSPAKAGHYVLRRSRKRSRPARKWIVVTNLGKQLRDGDPLADAPALPPEEVQRLRRTIVAASGKPGPIWSPHPLMVGVTVAATLAAGVVIGQRLPRQAPLRAGSVEQPGGGEPDFGNARRQVQFDTPGGTRIIWVIDPDFDL